MKTPKHLALVIILAAYFCLGTAYALLNPLWEAPDEVYHFALVQHLASNGLQLPSQEPGTVGLWNQEGNQPPLYYLIGAVLISGIDTSDIQEVLRFNPHANIGHYQPDGNANRVVHRTEAESFPGEGSVRAAYVLRFYSLLLGAGTIAATYFLAGLLFPQMPLLAIGAAAMNAFLPMFLYISAAVNNDNLSNLLGNSGILLLVSLLLGKTKAHWRSYILIGLLVGAGLLAKLNLGLLIPAVAVVLLIISLREKDWRPFFIGGVISGSITIVIAGWWYWRNWQRFADPTGLERFLDIVGRRVSPASLNQLRTERDSFTRTFWGLFGNINVPMSDGIYMALNVIAGVALLGAVLFILRYLFNKQHTLYQKLAVLLVALWPVVIFIAFLRWTSITPASQGRLIYGAISALALWAMLGLIGWLALRVRPYAVALISAGLFLLAIIQPWLTIAPAYAQPPQIAAAEAQATFTGGAGIIAVTESDLPETSVIAGDYLHFTVDLAVHEPFDRDWSLFVHLVSPEGIILAQRDVYPGSGSLTTSDLAIGRAWKNEIAVLIPPTTYAPQTAEVRLGWYHLPSGERMTLENGGEMLSLGEVEIHPKLSVLNVPNPQNMNFGSVIELAGYDLSTLAAYPGETLELTLYWQALQPIAQDYVVFANVIDPATFTKYAESNAMPVQWTRPTSTWATGEIIIDTHTLTIREDAVPGVYPIELGLYLQEDGFPRLDLLGTYQNFLHLTPVRILETDS